MKIRCFQNHTSGMTLKLDCVFFIFFFIFFGVKEEILFGKSNLKIDLHIYKIKYLQLLILTVSGF